MSEPENPVEDDLNDELCYVCELPVEDCACEEFVDDEDGDEPE